ncbi:tautomerase family protein [Pedobacter sp. L105]|uniref:tautomerase family protein n=1 Tax=Pedobacter sp. L105 TaxID=1641871 RepID=UPI00131BE282|nr:tautomerase family protein [Pedobacter sp. L105]
MPLITVTSLKGRTKEEKQKIGDAIQKALAEAGTPEADRFQRFFDMNKEDLIYDKSYPDMVEERSDKFIIIEIIFTIGKSEKIKRKILTTLNSELEALSIAQKDVLVIFQENAWVTWDYTGGQVLHA